MKSIENFPGYYASYEGDIYYAEDENNVEDVVLLEGERGEEGYYWLEIDLGGSKEWYRRCDLVAIAFLDYPPELPPFKGGSSGEWVLDHIDSDKENDKVENLEWVEWTNLDHDKSWGFIKKARDKHGKKYGYRNVWYINAKTKVTITCGVHGDFEQSPDSHLRKKGCLKCGTVTTSNKKTKTLEQFVQDARLVHGDLYDYSKVDYKGDRQKVIIRCRIHGDFEQTPHNHLQKQGCPKCAGTKKKDTKEFVQDARLVHGDLYDYSKVDYKRDAQKVIIRCRIHGDFEQTPNSHLQKQGCAKCAGNKKKDTEEFVQDAEKVHGDLYDYSKVEYKTNNKKIIICCKIHGDFEQTPNSHLQKNGCPRCSQSGYSQVALRWLTLIENYKDVCIQHAETPGGERSIGPYKADGYLEVEEKRIHIPGTVVCFIHPAKKIVFEFQGCYWHGCPREECYPNRKETNKVNWKTMGELYEQTQLKNKYLRDQGYTVVEIWECEYYDNIGPECTLEEIEAYMKTLRF